MSKRKQKTIGTHVRQPSSAALVSRNDIHSLDRAMQQAVDAYRHGSWPQAEHICRTILYASPRHFDALNLLGAITAQTGRNEEALECLRQAALAKPKDATARNNLGNVLNDLGHLDKALECFEQALQIKRDFPEAHYNLGRVLQALKRRQEALASYEHALRLKPDYAEAHSNRGLLLQELGQIIGALESYDRAIKLRPNLAVSHYNRGNALKELKRYDEALASYDRALAITPELASAHYNRGNALQDLARHEEALYSFDQALAVRPDFAEALNNRGNALRSLRRFEEALESCARALSIAPRFAEAHSNRGNVLRDLKQFGEALESYDLALNINPFLVDAHSNRGVTLQALKRFDDAFACYRRALDIDPNYAEGHWNLSICRLLVGDFANGWEGYESRWSATKRKRRFESSAPIWRGGKLKGSLLVVNEQGVGDEIFFAGMLNDLRSYASTITVCVDPRLVSLFARSFKDLQVVSELMLTTEHDFDAHIYMGDLGRYLRKSVSAFTGVQRYYLLPPAARVNALREQFANDGRLVCGLSWLSKNTEIGLDKSLSLRELEPILKLSQCEFIDLQYGDTSQERTDLYAGTGLSVRRVEEIDNFNDIDGLAALISACDVVVTVSNTTAHLAAALGKPVFLMLPFTFGLLWYWHDERTDSPWYPTVRVFRQPTMGDWKNVVSAVRSAIEVHRN